MSFELSLAVPRNVNLTDVARRMGTILQTLLNLHAPPQVKVGKSKLRTDSLGAVGDTATLEVDTFSHADLMILDLPMKESDRETQATAVISPGSRTPLSIVSSIALGLALAQLLETELLDEANLLTGETEVNPERLLQQAKLTSAQSDASQASRELLEALELI
jgi:hypothetical protein